MSVNPNWVITSVISFVSLLSLCLVVLSSGERGVLKSITVSVCGFICGLSFSNVSFYKCGYLCIWGINVRD